MNNRQEYLASLPKKLWVLDACFLIAIAKPRRDAELVL